MGQPGDQPGDHPGPDSGDLAGLVAVMARLRVECDWKAAQTHRTLARHLLEETHETLEAIDEGERTGDWSHLREELGDVLLQVLFHAAIAAERGAFDLDDVATDLTAKLIRRNPHVFGSVQVSGAASVNELWETMKAAEKRERHSVTDGLPPTLPALLYADKVLDRLARADRPPVVEPPVVEPVETTPPGVPVVEPVETTPPGVPVVEPVETTSPRSEDADLGDRLLALVAEGRRTGTDPEQALRDAVRRRLVGET